IRDGHVTGVQTCALPICRLRVPEERMCARFPRPRLHGVRLEGEDFVEALQGLAGSIVIQQNFPLREPRSDEIPFERDRAVVILEIGRASCRYRVYECIDM